MNIENLKEQIKLCLWAKKLTVLQIAAECGCDNDAVTEVLDALEDEGILQCEFFERSKTVKYWVKRDEFRIKELILNVLNQNDGTASRAKILEALPSIPAHQVDFGIKALKIHQEIHTLQRGMLKIGVKTDNRLNKEVFDEEESGTDKSHSSTAINPFYDPKANRALFSVKSVSLKMLDDGSLSVSAAGKNVILTPSESRQAFEVLKKVYGRAS